jgi:hypothetical protein
MTRSALGTGCAPLLLEREEGTPSLKLKVQRAHWRFLPSGAPPQDKYSSPAPPRPGQAVMDALEEDQEEPLLPPDRCVGGGLPQHETVSDISAVIRFLLSVHILVHCEASVGWHCDCASVTMTVHTALAV